jgi:Zn-dependent protease with chaperone function
VRSVRAIRARRQKNANALIVGTVPALRYVLLTDYLVDHFSRDELDAVVAHEAAHAKEHHLLLKVAALFLAIFPVGAVLALMTTVDVPAVQAVFALAVPVLLIAAFLLVQGVVGIHLEYRADAVGAREVGADPMVRALEKLATLNAARRRTGRLWNVLSQHPGIAQRVERIASAGAVSGQ